MDGTKYRTTIDYIEKVLAEHDKMVQVLSANDQMDSACAQSIAHARKETAELVYRIASESISKPEVFRHDPAGELPRVLRYYRAQMLVNAAMRLGSNPSATSDDVKQLYDLIDKELERIKAENDGRADD